jgi:4-hydroxybenzoyl-CoA thioesterase
VSEHDIPYRVTRRVAWGDCDPAGITYTPKNLEYAVEAIDHFFRDVVGISWIDLNLKEGMGEPMVRAEVDYIRPMRPDCPFTMEVTVEHLGRSSVIWEVTGLDGGSEAYFKAKLVGVFIDREKLRSIEIPERYRERIMAYQAACREAEATRRETVGAAAGENGGTDER